MLDNANLVANGVPGQTTGNPTGTFYVYECTDPGGLSANLPTQPYDCEAQTLDLSDGKSDNGAFIFSGGARSLSSTFLTRTRLARPP